MKTNLNKQITKAILILFTPLFLLVFISSNVSAIPMFQARSGLYVPGETGRTTGYTDPNSPNKFASGTHFRDGIVGEKSREMRNNFTTPTSVLPALYNNDQAGEWYTTINPNVDQIVVVWETRDGLNGWTGNTWVAGHKSIITQQEVTQSYKSMNQMTMEPIPTPALQSSTLNSITIGWTGLWDNSQANSSGIPNNSITGYTLYRSVNGGSYTILSTTISQNAGGAISYTDNTVSAGNTYKYRLGVKFSWTANATGYYESIGKGPESVEMQTIIPEADRVVILGTSTSIVAGNKTAVRTLETRDSTGNARNVSTDTTITLSSNSTGINKKFFSVSGGVCTSTEITTVVIADGTSQGQFCYYDEKTSTPTWTLTATKTDPASPVWLNGTQSVTVTSAALESFSFTFADSQKNRIAFTETNTITAYDSYGNIKTDFNASTNNVTISTSPAGLVVKGLAGVSTNLLNQSSDFVNGVANLSSRLSVNATTLGTYTFTATSTDSKVGSSSGVTILAGNLDHFEFSLTSPQRIDFAFVNTNTLTAKDIDNHTILDFNASTTNVTITESATNGTVSGLGSGENNVLNQSNDFVNGVANLSSKIKYIGSIGSHQFRATAGSANTLSNSINFTHGDLDKFNLAFNTPQNNDQYFSTATITARDKGNNPVLDFDASSNNVTVSATNGTMTITGYDNPILNLNNSFINGVATLNGLIKFTGIKGTRTISVSSANGKTGNISVLINAGSINSVRINNASGEAATDINDVTMTSDDTLNLWAASYDISGNYINNIPVDWTSGGTLDTISQNNISNISFSPTTAPTSGTISITDGSRPDSTGTITVNPGVARDFIISAPETANAGIQFNLNSIVAKDNDGNTATSYNSSHTLVLTGAGNGPESGVPTASISCTFNSGVMVSCSSITLVRTQTVKITLTDGSATGQSNDIVVGGGQPTHLHLTTPGSSTAGVDFNITSIYAHDAYGNISPFYEGGKTIAYSGPGNGPASGTPSYTTNVNFANGSSTTTLATTLVRRESTTIGISDGTLTGTSSQIDVGAGTSGSIEYVSGNDQIGSISSPLLDPLVVRIKDLYGNNKNGQNVDFVVTSGGGLVNPTSASSDTNGLAQTTFRLGSVVGSNNNTAEARVNGLTGSPVSFTASGTPATASAIQISAPTNAVAGTQFNLTVTAVDSGGNTVTAYSGSKTINFSGPSASPKGNQPQYTTSVTFNNGTATVPVTLFKEESTTITGTVAGDNFSGTSGTINVTYSTPASFEVIAPTEVLVGANFNLTSIKAIDLYGNYSRSYSGNKTITYSGPGVGLNNQQPSYTTNVNFVNGSSTTILTTRLHKAETATIRVTDSALDIYGDSNSIAVTFDVDFAFFYISGNNQTGVVGKALSEPIIVAVYDKQGNPATSKSVAFAPANSSSVSNQNATVGSDGQVQVTWTLGTSSGSQTMVASVDGVSSTITFTATAVSDEATSIDVTQSSINLKKNRNSNAISVCIKDQYGNQIITNVARTINLASNSTTGAFSRTSTGTFNATTAIIPIGSSCTQIYYKDSSLGAFNLNFTSDGLSGDTLVANVEEDTIVRIEITPASFSIGVNQTKQLTAKAFNDLNQEITGITFVWETVGQNVGAVTSSGLYYPPQTPGTYGNAIKVSYGGIIGYSTATVTQQDQQNNNDDDDPQVVYVPSQSGGNPITIVINKNYTGTGSGNSNVDVDLGNRPVILSPKSNSYLGRNRTVTISGNAPANKVILLEDLRGNSIGSATSDKFGYWKIQIPIQKFTTFGDVVVYARILNSELTSNMVAINIEDRTLLEKFIDLFY